ncbi:hypothetical protein AB0B88_16405 [Micromonospora haikouensis]|uniref:hypothetical protein n=1 Tax=Actinomycetes TaxID=1760 RepID=UPI0033F5473A
MGAVIGWRVFGGMAGLLVLLAGLIALLDAANVPGPVWVWQIVVAAVSAAAGVLVLAWADRSRP